MMILSESSSVQDFRFRLQISINSKAEQNRADRADCFSFAGVSRWRLIRMNQISTPSCSRTCFLALLQRASFSLEETSRLSPVYGIKPFFSYIRIAGQDCA